MIRDLRCVILQNNSSGENSRSIVPISRKNNFDNVEQEEEECSERFVSICNTISKSFTLTPHILNDSKDGCCRIEANRGQ